VCLGRRTKWMLALPSLSSEPRFHNRRCDVDLTTASPPPPFSPRVAKIPRSARSTAHTHVAEARWLPWAQLPSEQPLRFVVPPLRASRLWMLSRRWEMASPLHMGIKRSRYEGSFSSTPSRRFVRL
jgi:hypothetical protein